MPGAEDAISAFRGFSSRSKPGFLSGAMHHYVFDWGDTIMRDDRQRTDPMCRWPEVALVPEADVVLARLAERCAVSLATNAAASDEAMIRQALARVGVDRHFGRIFTARAIGRTKAEPEFWLHVRDALGARPEDVTVVGDSFEADVLAPVAVGMRAVWLNVRTAERRNGPGFATIGGLGELLVDTP